MIQTVNRKNVNTGEIENYGYPMPGTTFMVGVFLNLT